MSVGEPSKWNGPAEVLSGEGEWGGPEANNRRTRVLNSKEEMALVKAERTRRRRSKECDRWVVHMDQEGTG